ncbi:MAG: MotA/TolQ/ExbB proton channel family protein [Bacteroidetes bacterium]|nr:MotA/TolQ/ExbB proton channel family protein [Bacteroidota bacterium]
MYKRNVDATTIGGIILGVLSIFGSFFLEGGEIGALILLPAIIIVIGGTISATMIGTSPKYLVTMVKLLKLVVYPPIYDLKGIIKDLVNYATIARKDGLLTLDSQLSKMSDPFLKRILRQAIDGAEPEVLQSVAQAELDSMSDRHSYGSLLFQKMGGYSPTMGIIGTVMGLITTLASAGDDPDILIRHIATAFIATLWGVYMANLVWLPIAEKLRHLHDQELLYREIIVDGVLSIQSGDIPSVIKAKLTSKLPPEEQEIE